MLWSIPRLGDEHGCSLDIEPDCASIFIYLDPASGLSFGDEPGWVIVTGHVADPAAATCHYVVGPDWPGDRPDDEIARIECGGHFVVTGVSPSPG